MCDPPTKNCQTLNAWCSYPQNTLLCVIDRQVACVCPANSTLYAYAFFCNPASEWYQDSLWDMPISESGLTRFVLSQVLSVGLLVPISTHRHTVTRGGRTRSRAPSFFYDVMQSRSTVFLRGRRLSCAFNAS